jgi:hypothetical protein
MPFRNTIFSAARTMKATMSSAYSETLYLMEGTWRGVNKLLVSARQNKVLRTSITRTNRSGDRGSPCQSLEHDKCAPGWPFSRTLVLAEDKIAETQLIHLLEKPMC